MLHSPQGPQLWGTGGRGLGCPEDGAARWTPGERTQVEASAGGKVAGGQKGDDGGELCPVARRRGSSLPVMGCRRFPAEEGPGLT